MTYALTLADARHRSATITLESYEVHLDVTGAPTEAATYPVTVAITLSSTEPRLFLDYLGESVEAVLVDGTAVESRFDGSRLWVDVPVDKRFTVEVRGHSRYSRTGQGLHRFTDPEDGRTYLYSHFEPSDARRVYPCFDQPDLKARFRARMSVPDGWVALSNGGETAPGVFAETPPLSTYLTAFAAGEYVACRDRWRDVELAVWSRASMAQYLDEEFLEVTKQGLEFFHENYDYPYPWGKYDSVLVPEYNLGAMENPGLVTFTEKYLFRSRATRAQHAARANTILHEMCHMWFGDLVTPRWWDDLWLKESFAEFMGADASVTATDYHEAWANFAGARKNWAYTQDQLPTTHPIAAQIPDVDAARQNFDGITYAKGAAVLKQLVHFIGREEFYAGSREFFRAHEFSSASFADLLDSLSAHTSSDLSAWADAWLRTSGPDRLIPARTGSRLTITREGRRPHRLDVGAYRDGTLLERLDVRLAGPSVELSLPEGTDFVLLNDTDHTYALTGFDGQSLSWALANLSTLDDDLARAVAWTSLWNLTRDGELPVADYVEAALAHATAEPNPSMIARVLDAALVAARDYTRDEQLPTRMSERLWTLLNRCAPGSDAQLAVARVTIGALAGSTAPGATAHLRALLGGALDGLTVDNEIRWSVLAALSARGEASRAELDEELAADDTMNGHTQHLRAIWARPDEATKRAVYELATEPGRWANAEVDALIGAWLAPGSRRLRAGLTDRYFDDVGRIWAEHPIEIANRLVRGFYPDPVSDTGADSEVVDVRTDALLARELPGALRRVLLECQDGWRRRRRVRARN
ncbi:aminopeptidase N [Corynebacterium guangdongense]|uniref:Aminopeptidase N n=1 Tax=Corynebacterium guangdongense TaxID=1783348 RepID=A0ABU1ZXH7_9CORY|nr:aminopeptidase N [Corynebacterium guangdongense]MDR7329625.1 aminopeptidase N [Corynebacterium guangdongense]WJZ18190.1 Aminopeptidase N [Corynebacterium guangdongense]